MPLAWQKISSPKSRLRILYLYVDGIFIEFTISQDRKKRVISNFLFKNTNNVTILRTFFANVII